MCWMSTSGLYTHMYLLTHVAIQEYVYTHACTYDKGIKDINSSLGQQDKKIWAAGITKKPSAWGASLDLFKILFLAGHDGTYL